MTRILLLQTSIYRNQNEWPSNLVMGIVIVLVVVSIMFYSRKIPGSSHGKGYKRISRRAFRRQATAIGLSKAQIYILMGLIRSYGVQNPLNLLSNTQDLDMTLGKALRDIQKMDVEEAVKEGRKINLYRIKQHIDRVATTTNRIMHTKQLELRQDIVFQQDDGTRLASTITSNIEDFICALAPLDVNKNQVTWKKGSKITILIVGSGSGEVVFNTKVLGYVTVESNISVMLQHANVAKNIVQRKYRRRPIGKDCILYPINITEKNTNRKISRNAVVDKSQQYNGVMLNLSAGGCALYSHTPFPRGELIKIRFEIEEGNSIVVFGKIVDTYLVNRVKSLFHVKLTRVSSKNLNKIHGYVYDFA